MTDQLTSKVINPPGSLIPVVGPKNAHPVRLEHQRYWDKLGDIDIQNVMQSNDIIVFTEAMKGRDYIKLISRAIALGALPEMHAVTKPLY